MKFRLIAGAFFVGRKEYKVGDIINCNSDLTKKFRGKFEKAYIEEVPVVESVKEIVKKTVPAPIPTPVIPEKEEEEEVDWGSNVTETFSSATKVDVQIFKLGTKYNVFDSENLNSPMNKKPLKKSEVNAFVLRMAED